MIKEPTTPTTALDEEIGKMMSLDVVTDFFEATPWGHPGALKLIYFKRTYVHTHMGMQMYICVCLHCLLQAST